MSDWWQTLHALQAHGAEPQSVHVYRQVLDGAHLESARGYVGQSSLQLSDDLCCSSCSNLAYNPPTMTCFEARPCYHPPRTCLRDRSRRRYRLRQDRFRRCSRQCQQSRPSSHAPGFAGAISGSGEACRHRDGIL